MELSLNKQKLYTTTNKQQTFTAKNPKTIKPKPKKPPV